DVPGAFLRVPGQRRFEQKAAPGIQIALSGSSGTDEVLERILRPGVSLRPLHDAFGCDSILDPRGSMPERSGHEAARHASAAASHRSGTVEADDFRVAGLARAVADVESLPGQGPGKLS